MVLLPSREAGVRRTAAIGSSPPLNATRTHHVAPAAVHELIRMGVAVISAHTNADVAPGGVSHALARRIGLHRIRPLLPGEPSDACKVGVFVPPPHPHPVLPALSKGGGGRIRGHARC